MIVPLVTPFARDESLDLPALSRLVEHAIVSGAQGLMPTALGEHLHALPALESRTEAELG